MNKFVVFALMLLCLVTLGNINAPQHVYAAVTATSQAVHMVIEGKEVKPDVPPKMTNGRTLIPVRVISEGLGAKVSWNQNTQKATIVRDKNRLELWLHSKQAVVNGKQVKMDAAPVVVRGRMLLPVRFVGESLGSTIGWEQATHTVYANNTVTLIVNGKNESNAMKSYKLNRSLYVPAERILQKLGLTSSLNKLHSKKIIDSTTVAPVEELDSVLDGRVEWDKAKNQVIVERTNQLTDISIHGNTVSLVTSQSQDVKANAFALDEPSRVILDVPNVILSDRLQDRINRPFTSDQQSSLVKDVRYSQNSSSPHTVRVVIELNGKSSYTLTQKSGGLDVQFSSKPKKTGFLIVVDAGHGGKDNGASGIAGNVEKDFNLGVANRLVQLLKQNPNFQVIATRSTDTFLELSERVAIANHNNADLFISIHANSFTPQARGTETYYNNSQSKTLANVVHRHLLAATQFPDRKVQTADYYVIRNTKMPAVLTETGFITNSIENSKMISPAFQQKVAQALADAINEYYQNYR